jgi:hypothetical protein
MLEKDDDEEEKEFALHGHGRRFLEDLEGYGNQGNERADIEYREGGSRQ